MTTKNDCAVPVDRMLLLNTLLLMSKPDTAVLVTVKAEGADALVEAVLVWVW